MMALTHKIASAIVLPAIVASLFAVSILIVTDPWIIVAFSACAISGFLSYLCLPSQKVPGESPLPPAPPSWPILGHLHLLGTLPHQPLQRLSQRYGPLMYLRLGAIRMAVVSSPEMAREFLKHNDARFASRPHGIISRYVSYNFHNLALAPYGPSWQHLRKICALELFSPRRLALFRDIREEERLRMLQSIWEKCQFGGEVNLRAELWTLVYNHICRMLMGKTLAVRSLTPQMFRHRLESAVQLTTAFHFGDYFPFLKWLDFQGLERRVKEIMIDLDAAMIEIVDEHRRLRKMNPGSSPNDIIDVLLAHCEGNDTDAISKLTESNVKGTVQDLFGGGTDTIAATTEWAVAELLRCPRVMEKAQVELDTVVGRNRRVQESDLSELPYIQAIVKETMRLHPAAPLLLPHQNEEACRVAGYFIPAKTRLVVNVWAIARDASVWEDPLLFNPERFLSKDIDMKGEELQFMPFGAGRRICPGLSVGFLMATMALAALIHSFDWSLPPQQQQRQELDMSEQFGAVVARAKPLIAFPKARLSSPSLYSFHEEEEGSLQV